MVPTTRSWMRALAGAVLLVPAGASVSAAQQAVIVVRHAEKADQSSDAALSPDGMARAKALADLLRGAAVTHVLTSEYRRTRDTAVPLASRQKLEIDTVPARDLAALVARIGTAGPEAVVLVVAHSNTIGPMLAALGWPNTLTLTDEQYDDVFVLSPRDGARAASVLRLKYGRPTP
jgi:broad specificity phosphatase PhoE